MLGVANSHFKGKPDLLLLQVNQEKVAAPVKYEGEESNKFPHIYGPLNLDAVVGVDAMIENESGFFFPETFKLIGDVLIRKGQPGDEAEITSVHTHAWQESYKGIVPDQFLTERPLSFRGRLNWWRAVTEGRDPSTVFVAESAQHGIVGFCAVGPGRDEEFQGQGETGAIYCLDAYKNKGIGAALFRAGQKHLKKSGCTSSYLWVLQDNPTTEFYRRVGGRELDKKKNVEFSGKALVEVVYQWQLG